VQVVGREPHDFTACGEGGVARTSITSGGGGFLDGGGESSPPWVVVSAVVGSAAACSRVISEGREVL
jgi:hypothetical protein